MEENGKLKVAIGLKELITSTGIDVLETVSWGTHMCNFYDTKQDLLDILVPFFKAGLENNELCLWITANPFLTSEETKDELRKMIPGIDANFENRDIEILSDKEWYLVEDKFNPELVFKGWLDKLEWALGNGYTGLRVNGNYSWLDSAVWKDFIDYERKLNEFLIGRKIIALCTYPLSRCSAKAVLDVTHTHEYSLSKRSGQWEVVEVPSLKQSKEKMMLRNTELEERVFNRNNQMDIAIDELKNEVAEHKQTENSLMKSEANFRSVFENIEIAFILLDIELNIILFNGIANKWAKLAFGVPYELGMNMLNLILDNRKQEMIDAYASVLKGSPVSFETDYPMEDGATCWYSIDMFPIKLGDGENIGICISAEDVSARRLAEVEKEKMTLDIIQRNKDLEQFSYIISHNLRSPVSNIMGFAKILSEKNYEPSNHDLYVKQLKLSVDALDEIIRDLNQILQRKRDVGGKKEHVKFQDFVDNIKNTIHTTIEKQRVEIITDFAAAEGIYTIKSYLYSVFYNLITNSIKYAAPGCAPVIEVTSSITGDKIILTFKDNGMGIDLNAHGDSVFGLYKRFHQDIEGKGIGLYMVKTQVESIDGKIGIESKIGEGTKFTIVFNT